MSNEGTVLTFDDRDEYQRRPIAQRVIRLLSSEIGVSPLVIDGSWGTGKTEFCQKLIALVGDGEAAPFRSVYVDAFRADHADQPLMTLLAAVLSLMPEQEKPTLIKKALPALRFGLKATGKAAIGWLLKQDAVELGEDFEKAIQTAGESIVDKTVETMLSDHVKAEESIRALQDALATVAAQKPIVLFVDELDRCRPDFAVAMLEIIKHVFNVKGVKIVLVTNTQQLKAAINHCYGSDVDAQRYLDKFLGFSFRLPASFKHPVMLESVLAAQTHFRAKIKNSLHLNESALVNEEASKLIDELIESKQLSLREVETLARYLEIYQVLTDGKGLSKTVIFGYLLLRIYAIYCLSFDPSLASEVLTGKYSPIALADSLGKSRLFEPKDEYWPPRSELLLAMLVLDYPGLPPEFTYRNDNQKEWWARNIKEAFRDGFRSPGSHKERIQIVQDTIRFMEMGV